MPLLSSATVLGLIDSMAILLSQAYHLAQARLASADPPILRLLVQRGQEGTEANRRLREVEILRAQLDFVPSVSPCVHISRFARARGYCCSVTLCAGCALFTPAPGRNMTDGLESLSS